MMYSRLIIASLLFALLFLCDTAPAQDRNEVQGTFRRIGDAFAEGDVEELFKYISGQCYLSLSDGTNGYYSTNQLFYLLEDYFRIHKPMSFHYSQTSTGAMPFATGVLHYQSRGLRRKAQIFISLNKAGEGWEIAQLTVK